MGFINITRIGQRINNSVDIMKIFLICVTVNIAGLPAISTTCGYDSNGMPIGMSLTGKAFDEQTIIAVCDRYEKDFAYKEAVL